MASLIFSGVVECVFYRVFLRKAVCGTWFFDGESVVERGH
jgi:hypothetical protein